MEIVGIGILFAIGFYIMPFVVIGVVALFSVIAYAISELFSKNN